MVPPLTEGHVRAGLGEHEEKLEFLNMEVLNLRKIVVEIMEKAMATGGHGGRKNYLVSQKDLSPEKYNGPRTGISFRQWGQDLKDMVSRFSDKLHKAMVEVEGMKNVITNESVSDAGINMDEDRQLRSAIRAFTVGEPRAIVNTEFEKDSSGIVIWRLMTSLYDPDNEGTRLEESTFVMNPGKAKSLNDVHMILTKWEDALNRRARSLGKPALDDDLKRSVLLRIIPDAEEKELRNQRVLYKTYESLRSRVLEIINERTKGSAAMLYNTEEEEKDGTEADEWTRDEDGEWIPVSYTHLRAHETDS